MICVRYDQGLVLFIFLHQLGTSLAPKACMSSIPTVQYVPSCPSTEADWVIAAKRKMCSSVGQNCSTPDEFVYHCLVNSFFNATLEVCAPIWKMNGFCPEFNIPGSRIQNVLKRDCTKYSDKCPGQYDSSEVYKYPSCFRLKQANDAPSSRLSHSEWKILSITLIVIAVIVVAFGILFVLFQKYRKSINGCTEENGEQGVIRQPMIDNGVGSNPTGTETPSESNSGTTNASRPKKKSINKDKTNSTGSKTSSSSRLDTANATMPTQNVATNGQYVALEVAVDDTDKTNSTGSKTSSNSRLDTANATMPTQNVATNGEYSALEVPVDNTGEYSALEVPVDNTDKTNSTGPKTSSNSRLDTANASMPTQNVTPNGEYSALEGVVGNTASISSGSTHIDNKPTMEEGFIVAAINLGKTYTKYGYSFVSEERSVRPESFVKQSCILINPDDEVLSFGDKALQEFTKLGDHHHHKFVKDFSMLNEVSKLTSYEKGSNEELSTMFVKIFTCLKKKISEEVATKFRNMQITHWILSVPFKRKKGAEDFLKSTADQAGITTNLHIVEEQQAVLSWSSYNWRKEKDMNSQFDDSECASTSKDLNQQTKNILNVHPTDNQNMAVIGGSIIERINMWSRYWERSEQNCGSKHRPHRSHSK